MVFASREQYREFIDTFILLKFAKNSGGFPYFVVFFLLIGSGGTIFFLLQRMKIKDERIRNLENDLDRLQGSVRRNASSKKTNKQV